MGKSLACPAAVTKNSINHRLTMFDILVYLFENYLPEACPEPDILARKLSAIGFETEDINDALAWLAGLQDGDQSAPFAEQATRPSLRVYIDEEINYLPVECRGFLTFLEQAEAITPALREMVIERALALSEHTLTLSRLKIIVLMVMWRHQHALDTLLLEELLVDGEVLGENRLCH